MVESLCFDSPAILDVGTLVDCASVRELNYGLMANNDQHAVHLLTIILNDVTLRRRLVSAVSANGVVTWNDDEVRRYLSNHSSLMENILFLVHLTSGMPGRATELATYTIANGASVCRAVIKSGKRVCLSAQYSKTDNLRRSTEPVARYLDEEISSLLVQELLVIRPLVIFISKSINHGSLEEMGRYLFVADGKKMDAADIRSVFASKIVSFSGQAVNFSQFRHLAKYIQKDLVVPSRNSRYFFIVLSFC
jgi:hypothetical protein